MKFELLTIEDTANLIEQAEQSGHIIKQEQTSNEIVYRIQDGADERLLINTPCSSYLISHGV